MTTSSDGGHIAGGGSYFHIGLIWSWGEVVGSYVRLDLISALLHLWVTVQIQICHQLSKGINP